MKYVISGIQQIGIGVPNADDAWAWYRKHFGMDVPMFKEAAEAALMLPYTGGEPRSRYAILAINLHGGGGFEIWQYTSRTPQAASFKAALGDYGIFVAKIKSIDVERTYQDFLAEGVHLISAPRKSPSGELTFFLEDPYGNIFQVVHSENWFNTPKKVNTGGAYGAIIGVANIDEALPIYQDLLGYNKIVYDETASFPDFLRLNEGNTIVRRVLLRHSETRKGAFAPMLGDSEIELVQRLDGKGKNIFKDRFWGDLGFIHLCFDVRNMDAIGAKSAELGYPFTVDSGKSFDMGEAAGRFTYIETKDGTLIEFVETHKIPVAKKLGWYLSLKKRAAEKPLPRWMLNALSLNREKTQ